MKLPLKAVIESVLIGVISTLFVLLISMMPILNVLAFLWPVPLIVVGVRRGIWAGILSLLVAGILMSILFQPLLGILFMILHFFLVVGLSYGLRKRWDFYENILLSSLGAIASILIALKGYSLFSGQAFFDTLWQGVRDLFLNGTVDFNRILVMYHQMGILKEFTNAAQLAEFFIDRMQVMIPTAIIIFSLIVGVLNLVVARLVLRRFHYEVPYIPEFGDWALPRGMGLGFLVLLLASYLGTGLGIDNFHVVFLTIYSLISFIFMVQGLSVLWYFLKAGNVPLPLRWVLMILIYIFVHMLLTLNMGLTLLGMFEQIFRLRKRYRDKFLRAK